MSLSDFALIERYFDRSRRRADVRVGIGDDAAVLTLPPGTEAVVAGASRSVETQDSGLPPASEWAHGVLEEVLAGLAAAGGTPAWLTLAITLPTPDVAWVEAFSGTLLELAAQAGLELVGGDTTAGPASVTVHVQGWVPRRDGASRERRPRATEGSAPAPAPAPRTEGELLKRAEGLAGLRLEELGRAFGLEAPPDLRRAKGWAGQLVEAWLGADAGSLAEPDFRALGIELKTLPVGRDGGPLESTYVCTVPLEGACAETWKASWVRRKLARVLWVPIEADRGIPVGARRIGSPLLWSLEPDLEETLRADWEELMEMVCLGRLGELSARTGTFLQVRPKAASSRTLCRGVGEDGAPVWTNPRGFYLRTAFTREVLRRHYARPR